MQSTQQQTAPQLKPARIKATFRGRVLGWFDTSEEAVQAIDEAVDAEEAEERRKSQW